MTNEAHELHEIFSGWLTTAQGSANLKRRGISPRKMTQGLMDHVRAMTLLGQLAIRIDDLESDGREVGIFRLNYPRWVQGVLIVETNSWNTSTNATNDFPEGSMMALKALADVLDHPGPDTPLDPTAVRSLNALLADVLEAAEHDGSLSDRLVLHIHKAVRHLQICIDEYHVVGESETMEAYDATWAAMGAAAHESSQPGRWEKFRSQFFYPTAAGFIANIGSGAIQIAAGG